MVPAGCHQVTRSPLLSEATVTKVVPVQTIGATVSPTGGTAPAEGLSPAMHPTRTVSSAPAPMAHLIERLRPIPLLLIGLLRANTLVPFSVEALHNARPFPHRTSSCLQPPNRSGNAIISSPTCRGTVAMSAPSPLAGPSRMADSGVNPCSCGQFTTTMDLVREIVQSEFILVVWLQAQASSVPGPTLPSGTLPSCRQCDRVRQHAAPSEAARPIALIPEVGARSGSKPDAPRWFRPSPVSIGVRPPCRDGDKVRPSGLMESL